ncbi:MAG: ABC transporter substrate-binding protein [Spirochaetes bacterium]|nr:MAG: ABC transporter substrate-binding protein [Spirochaetota bacterium]RKX93912.1 MAG: ABC transporter substrate-binding protein [Spirochaetota bacterium]
MILFRKSFSFLLIVFLLTTLIMVLPAFARGSDEAGSRRAAITLKDNFDREITLGSAAMTVVSLSPGITETVFALGYGNRLLGRTDYCDYPPEAASVLSVGSLTEPDIETIVALNPDIVIASTHFPKEALDRLVAAGENVAVLMGQESFQGAYDGVIRPVSLILGDSEAGEALVASMEATVDKALAAVAGFTRTPSVYYVVGFGEGGDWTAGGNTFISEMIEMAGGKNIAADISGWSFSLEAIVDGNPDLILLPGWAEPIFKTTPVYSDLRAVKEGHAIVIDENAIVRQGPRLAEGFADLVNAIGSVN